jgi:aminopeptidase N
MGQSNPDRAGHDRPPLQIPVAVALFDQSGNPVETAQSGNTLKRHEHMLELKETENTFIFEGVAHPPIVSLLRGFSAPVVLETDRKDADLAVLAGHDNDPFSRWDAGQTLARKEILRWMNASDEPALDDQFVGAFGETLRAQFDDLAFQALALRLPEESYLSEMLEIIDPARLHLARHAVMTKLATQFKDQFFDHYQTLQPAGPYQRNAKSAGERAMRNLCLSYLMVLGETDITHLALDQLKSADNMTDAIAALTTLANQPGEARHEALSFFEKRWQDYPLVMDKWLRVQAISRCEDTIDQVQALTEHRCYEADNPNKVHSLIGAFAHSNPIRFHREDGAGYEFVADQLLKTDAKNPQVAARLASAFNLWRRFEPHRREGMKKTLEHISAREGISRDVSEIIERALAPEDSDR